MQVWGGGVWLPKLRKMKSDAYRVWEMSLRSWGVGMSVGLAAWVCCGCGGWCGMCFGVRVHENKKNAVNVDGVKM